MTQEDRGHTQTGMHTGGLPYCCHLFSFFFSSLGVKEQQQQQKYKKLIMIVIINNNLIVLVKFVTKCDEGKKQNFCGSLQTDPQLLQTQRPDQHTENSMPYSFSFLVFGFFNAPQGYEHGSVCETGPTVYRPYPRRLESLTICRYQSKGSTFSSVL